MSAVTPIVVCLKANEEITGVIVSEHLLPYMTAEGDTKVLNRVGVCWEAQRNPAISYHDPSELSWLSVPQLDSEDEEYEEEGEEYDDEGDDTTASDESLS